jgi:Xaa-Pro aminopeptidase
MVLDTSHRVADAAQSLKVEWFLLSGADSVCYASGHVVPIETGSSPFAGGPTLALVSLTGDVALVLANLEEASARKSSADHIFTYEGFSADGPAPLLPKYLDALSQAFRDLGVHGTIAVEPTSLPASAAQFLYENGLATKDGSAALGEVRAVKTDRELALLRRSARVASMAQEAVFAAATPGISELELFATLRLTIETQAGCRVPIAGDLVSGIDRTAAAGGWPAGRLLRRGDPVIADIAPRIDGYWADSCNTFTIGTATKDLRRMHQAVQRALAIGIETALPGIAMHEIDQVIRAAVHDAGYSYAHHSGHGIGTSVHEFPRIIPGEQTLLTEGMVILLEPGAYESGIGGVRLEHMFEVKPEGLQMLTTFDQSLGY